MMKEIDNYMTPAEAAYRWGVSLEAVKERLKPSRKSENLEEMINAGLIKHFKKPGARSGAWIISRDAMENWYGPEEKQNK